jgi:hypothetical protein
VEVLRVKHVRAGLVFLVSCWSIVTPPIGGQAGPKVNQDSLVQTHFDAEVKDYLKIHKKAQAGLSVQKATDSAETMTQRQHLLADNIRAARPDAKQGDLFTPEISQLFMHLIATSLQGSEATKIRASLRHAEPVKALTLRVNEPYPDSIPLQSTPPTVLMNLPDLPKELDYRIVGRTLVLRDVAANLIVDYLPNAIPAS